MKNKLTILAGAVAALVSFGSVVQATPIVGSIGFTGTYTQVGGTAGNLASATSMTINLPVGIQNPTGAFVGANTPTFLSPIGVNANVGTLVGQTLWTVIVGGVNYSLLVTTASQPFTSGTQLNLSGAGTIKDGIAADDTAGTWQLGFGVSGQSFTWQATTANNVPDGGMTVLLLGAALTGLFLVRKQVLA